MCAQTRIEHFPINQLGLIDIMFIRPLSLRLGIKCIVFKFSEVRLSFTIKDLNVANKFIIVNIVKQRKGLIAGMSKQHMVAY